MYDVLVLGGGAAGFFAALSASPHSKVAILEKSLKVLSKVRISGGGRCNVTQACFDPKELISFYPRGSRELLGPFMQFQPKDTMAWFEKRGVSLKIEEDNRVFPTTDSSETIINCLMSSLSKQGVELITGIHIESIEKSGEIFILNTSKGVFETKKLILATGSSPQGHQFAKALGHTIQPLVPSLFTFNCPSSPLLELSGITVPNVSVSIEGTKLESKGPLLLTHFGFSGPAILRLSAFGAKTLNELNYQAHLLIDYTAGMKRSCLEEKIGRLKKQNPSQIFHLEQLIDLPKKLAKELFPSTKRLSDLSKADIEQILNVLLESRYKIDGKTTNKQEFVTCGGVTLKEVNFKSMESRICPGLFFAGEILDIDGITGGFNFQNAWTTGYIAGR